ncbi:hypothetical protein ES702_03437 [subsurface metagenome]
MSRWGHAIFINHVFYEVQVIDFDFSFYAYANADTDANAIYPGWRFVVHGRVIILRFTRVMQWEGRDGNGLGYASFMGM